MSKFIRLPELCGLVGLHRSSIHRLESTGQFPKRRRIGERAVAWDAAEIEAWIVSRAPVDVACAGPRRAAGEP